MMNKHYCLVLFLFLSSAIFLSCGEKKCTMATSGQLTYKCSVSGSLSAKKIKDDEISPSVKELDFTGSNISEIEKDCFKKFNKLEILILSSTTLKEIKKEHLSGLKSLKILDLSNNQLTSLKSNVFDDLKNLAEVRLQNNHWDCNCETGLLYSLKKLGDINFGPVKAKCQKPEQYKKDEKLIYEVCATDECSEENDCDDVAKCEDTTYGYTCECDHKGFEDLSTGGKACIDIDECARENDCSKKGGLCINTHGTYKCSCQKGYKGDGKTCDDIDECKDGGRRKKHNCGEGECKNSLGSFRCNCREGYEENDQRVCVDIDECLSNNTCDSTEHSYCFNEEKIFQSDDGYVCLCETGYRKVGKSCVSQGNMKGLIEMIAIISGGFVGILVLIIISTVIFLKCKNRKPEEKKEEQPIVMAPVVAMDPLVDFGYLGMPQADQGDHAEEEWGDELDDDDDLE